MADEIKVGPLLRDFSGIDLKVEKREADGARLSFSASSESPVERFFGTEVLSHKDGSIRMERFARGAAPLLFNHSWDDPVGMITDAALVDGRLMVEAQMFATARAREVEQMIDGGLRNVSIGYQIHTVEEDVKRGIYRATDWEPLEVSIVTVPADSSVGIGRQHDQAVPVRVTRASDQPAAPAASIGATQMAESTNAAAGATADVRVVDDFDPAKYEAGRAETIRKLAATNDITDERQVMHWIRSGKSWDQIADDILRVKEERSKASPQVLGLTQSERQRFSIVRAINAVVNRDWTKAGFEAEVSRASAQRMGKSLNEHSFLVPADVLTRELIVGTAAQGGYLVGTDIQPQSFIDLLRNRSVAMRLGARTLSGLQGSVTIPTHTTAGAVGWLGESGTATEANLTVGQKTMSPKTVGGYQQYSRQLMLQSSLDVEALISADLAASVALAVDSACIAGTGTNTPTGVRYTSGLGTANPAAGTGVTFADFVKFQSTVAASNALFDNFSYVCHPAIAGLLMGKAVFTYGDSGIWQGALLDGTIAGRRAMASVQVTSGTMLGGDWSQVVVGEWGPAPVEIEVNPYANFQAGIVGVRAMYSCDVMVRYGNAFAIGTGITG